MGAMKDQRTEQEEGETRQRLAEGRERMQQQEDGSSIEGQRASDNKSSSGSEEGYAAHIAHFPAMEDIKEGEKTSCAYFFTLQQRSSIAKRI